MAKDPAFLFYPTDFMGGTQFFTDDQLGKYLSLSSLNSTPAIYMRMIC